MATNIFVNNTKSLPKSDEQIIRIDMKQNEIAGRTDHIPSPRMSGPLSIAHVPSAGSKT